MPPPQHIEMAAAATVAAATAAAGGLEPLGMCLFYPYFLPTNFLFFARLTFLFFFTIRTTNRDDDEWPRHHLNAPQYIKMSPTAAAAAVGARDAN
jgi:hypothetical protein